MIGPTDCNHHRGLVGISTKSDLNMINRPILPQNLMKSANICVLPLVLHSSTPDLNINFFVLPHENLTLPPLRPVLRGSASISPSLCLLLLLSATEYASSPTLLSPCCFLVFSYLLAPLSISQFLFSQAVYSLWTLKFGGVFLTSNFSLVFLTENITNHFIFTNTSLGFCRKI